MLKVFTNRFRAFGEIKKLVSHGSEVSDRAVSESALKTCPDSLG